MYIVVTAGTLRIANSDLTPLALVFVLSVHVISRDIILANHGTERARRLAKIIFFIFVVISCRVESLGQLV